MHPSDIFADSCFTKGTCLVLGLDPIAHRLPHCLQTRYHNNQSSLCEVIEVFCQDIIHACAPHICGVKIQMACFECLGSQGIAMVEKLILLCKLQQLPVIIDAKRGDIDTSSMSYAQAYLHPHSSLCGDALTINPWLGKDSLQPFVDAAITHNKLVFVLVKTSNPDAGMFQEQAQPALVSLINDFNNHVTRQAFGTQSLGVVGAVVGATHSKAVHIWRCLLPASWLLCPGVGTQQGDIAAITSLIAKGAALLVPISRALLYASHKSDYAIAAGKQAEYFSNILRIEPSRFSS